MQNPHISSLFRPLIEEDDGKYIGQNANLTSLLTIKRPQRLLAIINGYNSTSRGRRSGVSSAIIENIQFKPRISPTFL